jgi:hypothetical protein
MVAPAMIPEKPVPVHVLESTLLINVIAARNSFIRSAALTFQKQLSTVVPTVLPQYLRIASFQRIQ